MQLSRISKKTTIHYSQGDSGFLFDHEDGTIYLLNATGMYIYSLLDQGMTLIEVIDKVSAEFCIDKVAIAREIEEFVAELRQMHLLRQ